MGDRSYVNLAEGISAVSYVWLCTCMQMHFVIGMASSCLKARLLAKQPEAMCTSMVTLRDWQHWDTKAQQHGEPVHMGTYRVLVCIIAEVLSSS